MIAITTRYAGPTDTRGARIIARSIANGPRTIPYNYSVNDSHAHAASVYAAQLARVRACRLELVGSAALPGPDDAHVFLYAACYSSMPHDGSDKHACPLRAGEVIA